MAQFTLLIIITLYLLGSVIGEPQIAPQLFLNRLNISYGINYKYNGQLNHNIDRVWVVTKIKIPSFKDIKFPNISFNPECKFLERLRDGKSNTNSQIQSVRQICRDSAPLVKLFQYKEDYKQRLIRKLLKEDLQLVLKGKKLRGKRSTHTHEVPQPIQPNVHNSTHKMGRDLDSKATLSTSTNMESLLMGNNSLVTKEQFLHVNSIGRLLFANKLNIYLTTVQETQLRLYDELERVLKVFLSAAETLSKGYLPASLFPPSVLHNITSSALAMVQKKNPDYVLTIKHVTEYYDMKMVTFGVNDGVELVVAFPVFVQDHTRESMTLYELETVKVPITDTNLAANSYTEVQTSKPYIAFNNDYYIQLHIPELRMCKQIWHTYYCEELFLVKHKSKHSCESAIYYNLT